MTADCSRRLYVGTQSAVGFSPENLTRRTRSMARKLKSDKVLFIATLLLVVRRAWSWCTAPRLCWRMNRYSQPYFFLIRQAMWAALGLAAHDHRHALRLSQLPRAVVHLAVAWRGRRWRSSAVLFSRPINGSSRWFGIGGIGVQPSELAKLSAIFFIAAHSRAADGPHRRNSIRARAHRARRRHARRADPARAGFGHVDYADADRGGHGVCRWIELPVHRRRDSRRVAGRRTSC